MILRELLINLYIERGKNIDYESPLILTYKFKLND